MIYPKINTLYTRDKKTFKVTDEIRCPEFSNIKKYLVTEKINGRNHRILLYGNRPRKIDFLGRTDRAEMPPLLMEKSKEIFDRDKLDSIFDDDCDVTMYAEAYGDKVQKGGGNYRKDISFRLFDVLVDNWWLEWDDVVDIANKIGIKTVPSFGVMSMDQATGLVEPMKVLDPVYSDVAKEENNKDDFPIEGIVARAYPMMMFRNNNTPIRWKLKRKDY